MKISATIITLNEEKHIEAAVRSLDWADEIVVIDSGSTDRTREIAESLGAVVKTNAWPGFSVQKQLAVDTATYDWIFSLDADERVSPELKGEILKLRENGSNSDGYRVPRLSYYMGRPIRHGGWYPDLQLRLFDRRKGSWNGAVIHESVRMVDDATTAQLAGNIIHYTVEDTAHHQRMIVERYAPLGAEKMFEEGRTTSPLKAVVSAWFAFVRSYFLKFGMLDGFPGFCIAYFSAHHTLMKHLALIELRDADAKK